MDGLRLCAIVEIVATDDARSVPLYSLVHAVASDETSTACRCSGYLVAAFVRKNEWRLLVLCSGAHFRALGVPRKKHECLVRLQCFDAYNDDLFFAASVDSVQRLSEADEALKTRLLASSHKWRCGWKYDTRSPVSSADVALVSISLSKMPRPLLQQLCRSVPSLAAVYNDIVLSPDSNCCDKVVHLVRWSHEPASELMVLASPLSPLATALHYCQSRAFVSRRVTTSDGLDAPVLVLDTRALPGSEGGLLVCNDAAGGDMAVCGMLTLPLAHQHTGRSVVPLALSAQCLSRYVSSFLSTLEPSLVPLIQQSHDRVIEEAIRSVVVVKVGPVWASGLVLLSRSDKTFVVTNAHVIVENYETHEDALLPESVQVRLNCGGQTRWISTSVEWVSRGPYDLALLSFATNGNSVRQLSLPNEHEFRRTASSGRRCFSLGFAQFDPCLSDEVSVSRGVVSRVMYLDDSDNEGKAVLLHATARNTSGNSGGMVLAENGTVLGIVVANLKFSSTESPAAAAVLCGVNLAIPSPVLRAIQLYLSGQSAVNAFDALSPESADPRIARIWAMTEQSSVSTDDKNSLSGQQRRRTTTVDDKVRRRIGQFLVDVFDAVGPAQAQL
ncbi:MAG: hypothetical protein MHM6MM_000484 [Cercozoa sp. M6MM]